VLSTRNARAAGIVGAAVAGSLLVASCSGSSKPRPAPTSPTSSTAPTSSAAPTSPPPLPDWPTYHGDLARTGVSTTMPAVTRRPRVVASVRLDGAVYASPIVVGGITVAATEQDSVYGVNAAGHRLWHVSLGRPAPRSTLPCGNIDPLGITGTPTYDAGTGLIYLVAELANPPHHQLVALDPKTGRVAWRRSVDLPGVETRAMQERGALTVAGGRVWVPFGGLAGDCGGYKGRVVGVSLAGSHDATAYTVPTGREGGIWTPPGPVQDASGHLFVSVGNGASGVGDPYDHSDSVLELTGSKLTDSFSPSTWPTDNDADLDLGSQAPALVGTSWVFIAGKSGTAYVLRQGHLGGIGGQVSKTEVCRSFGGTAVVGSVVYVPCTDGVRAVRIGSSGGIGKLWRASSNITGSPVVGGGYVWTLDPTGGSLHALDPRTGHSAYSVPVGVTSRFATPAISGSDLIVPTLHGVTIVATS
jgi:PQQ-like domain